MPTIAQLYGGFRLGEWEVLPAKGILRRGDEIVRPEPRVLAVLLALAQRDRDLVTKDQLIAEVWDGKAFSDEPILRAISLLRGHFEDHKPFTYIETLPRRGYRLLRPVELHEKKAAKGNAFMAARSRGLWQLITVLVVIGVAVVAALNWIPREAPPVQSLAFMPIDNLSGDPKNDYIALGIKNFVAHRLASVPGLTIKNARVRYYDEPSRIAKILNVESVLTAAMQLQEGTLKVTWQVARGADNVTIGSGEVSGRMDGVFALQERLARAVLDDITGARGPRLITVSAPDSAAYISYMRGMYLFEHRGDGSNLETAMELFDESIRLDESYGPAYLALASAYALLPSARGVSVDEAHTMALKTIERGILVDSSIEDSAGSIFGFIYHQQKRWIESEAAHLRAVNASVVDSNSFNWYSRMLSSVGRLEEALKWALAAERIDPDNPVLLGRIAIAYTWLQQSALASEYFKRADELGEVGVPYLLGKAFYLLQQGRIDEARELSAVGAAARGTPTNWVEPVFAALSDRSRREAALQIIKQAWSDETLAPQIVLTIRTMLGDVDGAMEIARLLEQPGEAFEMDLLFVPEMRALRSHPEFMPLLDRLGVVDYWRQAGCKWSGDTVSCDNA